MPELNTAMAAQNRHSHRIDLAISWFPDLFEQLF